MSRKVQLPGMRVQMMTAPQFTVLRILLNSGGRLDGAGVELDAFDVAHAACRRC